MPLDTPTSSLRKTQFLFYGLEKSHVNGDLSLWTPKSPSPALICELWAGHGQLSWQFKTAAQFILLELMNYCRATIFAEQPRRQEISGAENKPPYGPGRNGMSVVHNGWMLRAGPILGYPPWRMYWCPVGGPNTPLNLLREWTMKRRESVYNDGRCEQEPYYSTIPMLF